MRGRFVASVSVAALICLGLAGCVSAANLNSEIGASSLAVDASVPADPCPGESGNRAPAIAALEQPPESLGSQGGADLDVGVALIAAAGDADARNAGNRTVTYAKSIERALGFDLAQFADQTWSVSGQGALEANQALKSPALDLVSDISALATPTRGGGPATRVDLRRSEWLKLTQQIGKVTQENGWTSAFAESLGGYVSGSRSAGDRSLQLADLQKKYLLAAYMTAYFRNGEIFSLEFNQDSLKSKLIDKLRTIIKDETVMKAVDGEIDKLAGDFKEALCAKGKTADGACVLLGVIGEQTFVTRAGKSYGFPGVTASLDIAAAKKVSTNKLNTDEIIVDLVRVVFEALGDQTFKVPGAKNSTFCAFDQRFCGAEDDVEKLTKVNTAGDRVEAGANAGIGAAIRGGWLFALNNETLARSITTAVSVSLRKSAEAMTWKKLSVCPVDRANSQLSFQKLSFQFGD